MARGVSRAVPNGRKLERIEVGNASVRLGGHWALRDVSLDIRAGEHWLLATMVIASALGFTSW